MQQIKSYRITAPRILEDAPDLYKAFMVAHNMTTDLREEFAQYDDSKKAVRYTDPFSENEFEANEDFWHVPFFSIGNVDGNGLFARVSAQHTDPSTLYIAFRPMNLDGVDDLIKGRHKLEALSKFSQLTPLTPSTEKKNIDNLIHITHAINDINVATGVGVSVSFYNMLMQSNHMIQVENWFTSLAKKTKSNPFKAHFTKDVPIIFKESYKVSVIQAIAAFITYYKPREVVFTGFSYGSSLAMAASILTKRVLQTHAIDISVYQFAGPKVCSSEGRDYAMRHFKKVVYVALTRDHKTIDPVTALPHGQSLVHVGDMYCMDVARHTIRRESCMEIMKHAKPITMNSLVIGYVLKKRSAETFRSIHLAGEDMIKRILLAYMIDNKLHSPIVDVEQIPCEFFSSAGYPAKYKVCPVTNCQVTTDEKQRNQCVNK
jgi:hypothetical protein